MIQSGLKERQIIEILKHRFVTGRPLPLGFEDDIAVYPFVDKRLVALKSDMLVGSTDVPPGMTVQQAARKAVVATVSDFAAKGVQPRALLVSLGLVPPVTRETVKEIARGLEGGAREYGCRIIGGDTGQANDLIIDCLGFGLSLDGRLIPRNGARPGDIVATTGDFGRTAAGLKILNGAKKYHFLKYPRLIRSVLHPVARLRTGLGLARSGGVTGSIDSSDGLAWSLHEIASLSKVDIILEHIPVPSDVRAFADEAHLVAEDLALYGGEEYELVLTIQKRKFRRLKAGNPSLRVIGFVEHGTGRVRTMSNGGLVSVKPKGYEHFR